jgi:predicted nucleotidyltransferase
MLTKEQINILSVFGKNLFPSLTFRQIKEQSRQRSNGVVQIAMKEFKNQGIVNTSLTGDVTTYRINLESNLALSYLNLINAIETGKKRFPKDVLEEVQKRLLKQTEFFILAVFGSHAKGRANGKSDLDIAMIVDSERTKKDVTPILETVKRREITPLDYHVFTRKEFLEMLKSGQENLGKQIYRESIIYYGYPEFCNLIIGAGVIWQERQSFTFRGQRTS